ncbi:MAG: IS200/IS605 family element transposase accessory protein TnpB, partial [Caldilineaceae bacterium SB0665_bin_21]|nr:IS200/IS605 family element transposase accessory protein TnpB [Caldilineaceae bacterium SB0665_bin_21]
SRLVLRDGRYHLHVSTAAPVQQVENQGRIVALDPGVRTFQTFYAEEAVGQFGDRACGRIQRLCQHLDNLLSQADAAPHRRKRSLYRAAGRIRRKIRNLVDELHHQVAHWLVCNYDIILLPDFRVQGMSGRAGRKIRRQTVRNLLTLSHHRLKAFLLHKAAEFGKQVVIVNEAYTSQTCSWSGELIPNLGGRKVVTGSDGVSLDRDVNGARGIFLRALVDTPWLQECLQPASRSP